MTTLLFMLVLTIFIQPPQIIGTTNFAAPGWTVSINKHRCFCEEEKPTPDWTTEEIMREITINRNSIVSLSSSLIQVEDALKKISASQDSIVALTTNVIPIGFIYIVYKGQSSPSALWPNMKWADVTNEFAGQFFRALGGGSAGWDEVQPSCAPTISNIDNINSNDYEHSINLPTNGWSNRLFTGKWEQIGTATRFHVAGCEVRPINSAVRIWKRVE